MTRMIIMTTKKRRRYVWHLLRVKLLNWKRRSWAISAKKSLPLPTQKAVRCILASATMEVWRESKTPIKSFCSWTIWFEIPSSLMWQCLWDTKPNMSATRISLLWPFKKGQTGPIIWAVRGWNPVGSMSGTALLLTRLRILRSEEWLRKLMGTALNPCVRWNRTSALKRQRSNLKSRTSHLIPQKCRPLEWFPRMVSTPMWRSSPISVPAPSRRRPSLGKIKEAFRTGENLAVHCFSKWRSCTAIWICVTRQRQLLMGYTESTHGIIRKMHCGKRCWTHWFTETILSVQVPLSAYMRTGLNLSLWVDCPPALNWTTLCWDFRFAETPSWQPYFIVCSWLKHTEQVCLKSWTPTRTRNWNPKSKYQAMRSKSHCQTGIPAQIKQWHSPVRPKATRNWF